MNKHLFAIFLLTFFSPACASDANDIVWDYPGQQALPASQKPLVQSQWQQDGVDELECFGSQSSSTQSTPKVQRKRNTTISSVQKAKEALQLAAVSGAPRTE